MASITRKSEKTVATVSASSRKIRVSVTEVLTVKESKELRALLKEQEKVAAGQSDLFGGLYTSGGITINNPLRYYGA